MACRAAVAIILVVALLCNRVYGIDHRLTWDRFWISSNTANGRLLIVELGDNIVILCQVDTSSEQPQDHYENVVLLTNLDHLNNCSFPGNTDNLGVCFASGVDITIAVTNSPSSTLLSSFEAGQQFYLTSFSDGTLMSAQNNFYSGGACASDPPLQLTVSVSAIVTKNSSTLVSPTSTTQVMATTTLTTTTTTTTIIQRTPDVSSVSPVVEGTTSMLLEEDTPAETYNVEVECDIRPSSTADYCEVIAHNDDSTLSASATIMDGMATVTVTGLVCEETYSIVAGGIITNDVMMVRTLDGPRFHMETITVAACPVVISTTAMIMTAPTITMTITPTRSSTTGGSGDNSGAIVGIVVGGICAAIIVVVAIIILIYCCCRKNNKKSYTVEMHAVGPTHESVQPPLSDEVLMDTNPAYAVSTAGTVKVEDNPAYQTMTTNPGGGGGAGREIYYYEDIINDRNVKMTQNPAYTVP
ncbi:mucin-22-like isoform X2 [Dysidea avara]|uniref:mucin-22-like isoform X2 n=1 Tax=Dysidea avara TaxID=196820 RepID=UPI00332EF9C6